MKVSPAKEPIVFVEHAKVTVMESQKPKFSDLQSLVMAELRRSDWWDRCGEDLIMLFATLCMILPSGLLAMNSSNPFAFMVGFVAMGFCHHTSAVKAAHLFSHDVLNVPKPLSRFLQWFSVELIGAFPSNIIYDAHIKIHHPYTNIIGLGDSSTWKVPMLPRVVYMFIAPLLLPLATPFAGLYELYPNWSYMLKVYIPSILAGYGSHVTLLMYVSGFSFWGAVLCAWGTRCVFMIPYIYVNVFQHIGLNMYDLSKRPDKLVLMSTAVLNLPRNMFLDYAFGHSIINCHVEHHLFPILSDKMCLKVKPIVQQFFKENGLIYNEKGYMDRFMLIWNNYEELMVHAPAITELVSIH